MKSLVLVSFLFCLISAQSLGGECTGTPKKRPAKCYQRQVLPEDMPELEELLKKYYDGDDHEFANYLGDMIDKKEFRLGREENDVDPKILGKCGVHPKYQPFECYERNVLRRNKNELQDAYVKLHDSNLEEFNKIYSRLVEAKEAYFAPK